MADAAKWNNTILSLLAERMPWWFFKNSALRWMRQYVASDASHQWFTVEENFIYLIPRSTNQYYRPMVDVRMSLHQWLSAFELDSPWWFGIIRPTIQDFFDDNLQLIQDRLRAELVFSPEVVLQSWTFELPSSVMK